jgi:sugar/nucleoside kinase (ribokinase family)
MVQLALNLKESGAIFSLEPLIFHASTRSNAQDMLELLSQVDIVTPDWPAASSVARSDDPKEVLAFWSQLGPKCVAVRSGKRGSYVWDTEHDRMWHIPIVEVETIDPTGCGNAYGGGFCVGWEKTGDALLAGCYGGISASFMAQTVGCPVMAPEIEVAAENLLEQLTSRVKPL